MLLQHQNAIFNLNKTYLKKEKKTTNIKMGHYVKSPSSNHNSSFPNPNTKTLSVPSFSVTLPNKLDHTQTSFSGSSCIRGEVTARSCRCCPPHYHHLGSANIADDTWDQLENTPMNSSLTLIKNSDFLSAQTACSAESPALSLHTTCATNISQSRLLRGDGGIPLSAPDHVWISPGQWNALIWSFLDV